MRDSNHTLAYLYHIEEDFEQTTVMESTLRFSLNFPTTTVENNNRIAVERQEKMLPTCFEKLKESNTHLRPATACESSLRSAARFTFPCIRHDYELNTSNNEESGHIAEPPQVLPSSLNTFRQTADAFRASRRSQSVPIVSSSLTSSSPLPQMDVTALPVEDLEREYNRDTWRMYNRILQARSSNSKQEDLRGPTCTLVEQEDYDYSEHNDQGNPQDDSNYPDDEHDDSGIIFDLE